MTWPSGGVVRKSSIHKLPISVYIHSRALQRPLDELISLLRWSSGCRFFGVKSPMARISSHLSNRHCCVCSPLLFASEILCDSPGDSPTYSKQRLNEISPSCWSTSCVAWKPKIHKWPWCHAEWRLLEFVYGLLLGNCGYQTDRKKDSWPMQNHSLLAILLRDKIKIINTFHSCSTTITFLLL